MATDDLPIPAHFDPTSVDRIWRVPYGQRAEEAEAWARDQAIAPAHNDGFKLALVLVDVQNTFCIPGFELFVAGRSGNGAIEDNVRLCRFIYRNLHRITQITPTMDTHDAMQIFHPIFLVDAEGSHPAPLTLVSKADVDQGRWRFNPDVAPNLGITPEEGQRHLEHYVNELSAREKYDLTIWPYHVMLGGISHALVPAIEEAVFFHTIARMSQPDHEIKGLNPLTEHYSVLGPEVRTDHRGDPIAAKNDRFIQKLRDFDAVAIAGQAKSHCVAWTIDDLLTDISEIEPSLARKVYLLEDCTSPVVVPEVADYTDTADAAFERFADAGMHIVQSTDSIVDWPGLSA